MKKRHFACMLFAFLAIGVQFPAAADDTILAYASNEAGGKIFLGKLTEDSLCQEGEFLAMTVAENEAPIAGCWKMSGDKVFIRWSDETLARYYNADRFVIVEDN